MAKDDDRTNKPEEAGKWGTAGKSSGKNNKNGKGKEYKTDRRIDKVLQLAADRIDTIDSSASVPERLARAAKSSELLSAVWSLPPAQRLMFHHGMQVTDVEGDSTPGFDGNKEDAEEFISISSSEIARYQRLMYANGVKGSTRRCSSCCKAWMPPARAASCVTCSAKVTRWASITMASASLRPRSSTTTSSAREA